MRRIHVFEHLEGHGAPQDLTRINLGKNILEANEEVAHEVYHLYTDRGVFLTNVMGSPGSGKTTLIKALAQHLKIAVLEGDIASSVDSIEFAKMNVPVVQVNTDIYGSACHLEAPWVADKLRLLIEYKPEFVFIENVGNLVCPSDFNLGEHERLVVYSIPEGFDKPIKYPPMFTKATAVVLTKVDLAPVMDLDVEKFEESVRKINPHVQIFTFSAKDEKSIQPIVAYLEGKRQALLNNRSN
ncbi:MAG TPA: hydrogenase nickel incorporation protein HypB [Coprothermobacter proteolyticus]|uniref:Hydrogenase accessory protein HypB n=1 Tax=Coprothermobacter proteolyticus (strain ATCC 35245 / DSM 5265 / OCM 4 / BT) TaxID=309798 RepID=B5Y922_COPPD|nr:hydrogenase nickel incorporation protein HypB [Coprothermobacter proteolyticus]MBK6585942.1 hydrogenase nickel incorporation protein HypB [Coprothermobacter sp.]ACI17167.1 hydrogenase nickel incorporation protein HypB [Coprothermobacter proteolyticus DSM 5265]NLT84290.1 hydrogenase nickel incorporation protein HypB [Coprothermobacter proteolyticus]HOA64710.1 hydrogenase nickel incorporation protein HypB [Coprothermobacter proteolyticus]HOK24071.1 hydrogenase nickel incorporation protein Hyp